LNELSISLSGIIAKQLLLAHHKQAAFSFLLHTQATIFREYKSITTH